MDRSEWVQAIRDKLQYVTQYASDTLSGPNSGTQDRAGWYREGVAELLRRAQAVDAQLAAAPPPPAEQASGEWSRAADELRRADALANKSDKIDRRKVIGKAADNNLSVILAALSQRPVVDEAMVERACAASYGWWKYPENQSERPRLRDAMRAALTAALAPQQPEKGEG